LSTQSSTVTRAMSDTPLQRADQSGNGAPRQRNAA
jgi:hypothetical protein